MYLIPVPALADNDLWLLHDRKHAPVVSPAGAGRARARHNQQGLDLESILVKHPHTGRVMPTDLNESASIADRAHQGSLHAQADCKPSVHGAAKPDNLRLAVNCRTTSQFLA
jgi:hypothetical protein